MGVPGLRILRETRVSSRRFSSSVREAHSFAERGVTEALSDLVTRRELVHRPLERGQRTFPERLCLR